MRSWTRLHETLLDPDHLDHAARLTTRGKRRRADVALFLFRREEVLADLGARLADGSWRPAPIELVRVRDPKPRLIARSPVADWIVHTALVNAMEPALTTSLRPECFACREGMGTHRAAIRLLELARRHRYVLHLDIRAYFPSVDLDILRGLLARRIRDARFLAILDQVLRGGDGLYAAPWARAWLRLEEAPTGKGLPVGAYTSQVLASWLYLDGFDHHVKRQLRVPGYVRYVDDLLFFADHAAELADKRDAAAEWLLTERQLRLKRPQASVRSCRAPFHALGHVIDRTGLRAVPRARKKLRSMAAKWVISGKPGRGFVARSLASRVGNLLP